ncbi:MAG: ABC transporter ATP-binding protein [Beggiatoa sp. IS2]|nr:MAG: ABC transporter ATP-binding protein [Beggiatoa sp. IS2]
MLDTLTPIALSAPVTPDSVKSYRWQHIIQIALQHRREIVLAHLIAIFTTLLSVPIPLLIPLLVDEVLLNQPGTIVRTVNVLFPNSWQSPILYIIIIAVMTIFLRFITLGLSVWQTRQFTFVSKDIVFRIRQDIIQRLQRISMAEYETLGSGQVISHLVTDLDTIDNFISGSISRLLVAILTITGIGMVLIWIHWQLALFILLLNPVVVYLTLRLGRKVKELKMKENNAYALFQQTLTETLEAIQQIRAYNREQYYLQRVIKSADEIRNYSTAYAWKTDAVNRLSFHIFLVGFEIFRAVLMVAVLFSNLSIGEMFAVYGYLWFMLTPMQEILNIQYSYHSASAALRRINQLLALAWEPRYPHLKNPFKDQQTVSIRLDDLSFAYRDQDWILDHLSLEIKAGEKVAFVGASGGGKTTLVQILLGLYPHHSGQLYFNNVPITEIGLEVVRENVVTVLQHPALFNDTLRMNLSLGRELSDDKLWQALEIAQLSDFVKSLGQGLDTILGQRGVKLSGGQRQRVACARMILADPRVIILDEATSALDSETESKLHNALYQFLQGKTTIIIAHRLSAVKQADRVLVFDQGRIIEEGVHEDLMRGNGLYAKLYRK